ncbi:MAG: M20/M25/M40 family metallo-hydrolase [Deltaproteobacteria bacterium]|nr:M20/M25/M40 family metallo-hydrolase [Deltaproteobacteria bacterium]
MKLAFSLFGLFLAVQAGAASLPAGLRLIETSPALAKAVALRFPGEVRVLTENVILVPAALVPEISQVSHETTGHCGGFMDITDETGHKTSVRVTEALPSLGSKQPWIAELIDDVRAPNVRDFVGAYSGNFKTRLASSPEGASAPEWLRNAWENMARKAGRDDIKVETVPGPDGYAQKSVRITIPGADPELPVVVLGGHLDSINRRGSKVAPGADDDASGIAALTETFRVLLSSQARPKRTIEIFGYAAEELGLLGSRVIAQHYQATGRKVRAVLQLDMVAYPSEAHAVTFITDNVDRELTQWTEQLYGLYVGGDVKEDRCGYGCSDHASWTRYGYPSVMPFESPMGEMNHRIHTERDTWDELLDADHAAKFVKLAVAFAAQLSGE